MDPNKLRQIDALLVGNDYPPEVFEKIAPHVGAYLDAAARLRPLPLGAKNGAFVMLAGGKR